MASPTKRTDRIRARKARHAGGKRKAQLKNHGTTQSKAELFGDEEN